MEDLFRSYWWLLFPLGFFIASAFDQIMRYQRHRDTLNLIKSYTDQGKDPPAALVDRIAEREHDELEDEDRESERRARRRYRRRRGGWDAVVLFGVLALGFGFAAGSGLYNASGAFLIVTFVMVALCLSSLVNALMNRRD